MITKTYKAVYLFCGIGGGALGFQRARREYRGLEGRFETICGFDSDPEACADFEYITGARAVQMDIFSREQYIAWHGHEPPEGWREVTAKDLRAAAGEVPDMVFTSPPCKGFSALLPAKSANTEKYLALNELTIRGIRLTAEAWAPPLILMENVPRITTRGADFLKQIKDTLTAYGYVFHEDFHDLGEVGGLGQRRQRYLLIARNTAKMPTFVYKPVRYPLKSIGDVIAPLPMPGQGGGRMHRLPNLHFITWLRLALIPAGKDWRALETCGWENLRIEYAQREGAYLVQDWNEPARTVTGNSKPAGSSPANVNDPRMGDVAGTHNNVYRITRWEDPSLAVTGADKPNSGALCVADVRTPERSGRYSGQYQVADYDKPSGAIIGQTDIQCGALSVADPRPGYGQGRYEGNLKVNPWEEAAGTVTGKIQPASGGLSIQDVRVNCKSTMAMLGVMDWRKPAGAVSAASRPSCGSTPASVPDPRILCEQRSGTYGVQAWEGPAATVSSAGIDSGAAAVADVRVPDYGKAGNWIIISLDGTWHRPVTIFEKAMLQDFPAMIDGKPFQLCGNSDQRWNERIGNAVPVGAGEGIGNTMLDAMLANEYREVMYAAVTELWVRLMSKARFVRILLGRE